MSFDIFGEIGRHARLAVGVNELPLGSPVELEVILEKVFSTKNNKEWISTLLDNGIPAGPIYNMKEGWEDDHVNSRNMNIKIDNPNIKNSQNIGIVDKLKSTPGQIKTPAPLYGEHTEEI